MNEQCTDVQVFVGKDLGFLFPFTPLKTNMTLEKKNHFSIGNTSSNG